MVLKLFAACMDSEFELNSLDTSLKREVDNQQMPDGINCCTDQSMKVNLMEQHMHQQSAGTLQFPGELGPTAGSLPGGGNCKRAVGLPGGCMPGFSSEYHQFPPSPPFVAAVPSDSPAMQPDSRTNIMDDSMIWLTGQQPLDLRSDLSDESFFNRRIYGDMLTVAHGLDESQAVMQHHMHLQQQQKLVNCMTGYGGSVESVPASSSSGSFSASDDCDSLADMPTSPTFNQTTNGNAARNRNLMKYDQNIDIDCGLDDHQLIALSVRDLNRRLHGCPRDMIQRIKQKRRTLKNRGYAQNCRTKRIALKCELEKTNKLLQCETQHLMQQVEALKKDNEKAYQERDKAIRERNYYQQQLEQLLNLRSRECSQQPQLTSNLSNPNTSSPNSPEFFVWMGRVGKRGKKGKSISHSISSIHVLL